eukprot:TRINITY_DN15271_c0_g2_i1.p1 TRINITY_DN15271_c0_g2~~TRINITY_DN15271_c0_g2_i1.p1  ORF type:complete len:192 (+),score=31.80 TRINITY_DN15271_c0_g2_i1:88-663(+)
MFQSLDHECYLTEELLEVFDLSSQQPYYLTKDLLEAFERSIGAATVSCERVSSDSSGLSKLRIHLGLRRNATQADDVFKLDSHPSDCIGDPLGEASEVNDGIKDDASDSSSTIAHVGGRHLGKSVEVESTCDSLLVPGGKQPSDYFQNESDVMRGMRLVQGPRMGLIEWMRRCTPECPCNELTGSLKYIFH